MLNLMRMEMYRLLKGRAFYICFGMFAVIALVSQFFTYALAHPEIAEALANMGLSIGTNGDMSKLLQANVLGVYHMSGVSGGAYALIIGCLASTVIGDDFEHGFIKNILSVHENKWRYVLSKIVPASIVNLIYLTVTITMTFVVNVLCGNFFDVPPIGDILFYGVSVWFLLNGFAALAIMIYIVTRSNGIAIASAILLGSGIVVSVVGMIAGLFNADKIMSYTLYMNMSNCPYKYTDIKSLQALMVGIICCILYTVIAKLVLAKKDI